MKKLLVISSAPVIEHDDHLELDAKYVEGMRVYCDLWNGPVCGVLTKGAQFIPFGTDQIASDLPFNLILQNPNTKMNKSEVGAFDVVLAGGDNFQTFYLAKLCQKVGTKLFYIIENIPETRLQIIALDSAKSFFRKVYSVLWALRQEMLRKSAFKDATGLQANGFPAFNKYRAINDNTILYLDNRMALSNFATNGDIQAKKKHLLSNGQLRIIHSGRLETLKGAQDLIPIARNLVRGGVDFQLNIYGTGSLEQQIAREIVEYELQDHVFLHSPVDFKTQLVPISNKECDVFLSCHRQSDPSCTYLESMASGLAIFGYNNRMFSELMDKSEAGWAVPLGDFDALSRKIIEINRDRKDIFSRCEKALEFAKHRNFNVEFERRIKQLSEFS